MIQLCVTQAVSRWMPTTDGATRRHGATMRILFWSMCITLLSMAAPSVADDDRNGHDRNDYDRHGWKAGPLVKKVREATKHYRNLKSVDDAMSFGLICDNYCISGSEEGATGVHCANPAALFDGMVDVANPELLVYEPLGHGKLRLVAVEYVAFEVNPFTQEPLASPPLILAGGHLLHRTGAPNRFGGPPFLRLHVWAWKRNPRGTLADYNPNVSCDAQPLTH